MRFLVTLAPGWCNTNGLPWVSKRGNMRSPCTRCRFCSCLRFCTLTTARANQTRSIRPKGGCLTESLFGNHRRNCHWLSQAWQASLISNPAQPMAFEWLAMSGEMQLRFRLAYTTLPYAWLYVALPLASALGP